MNLVVNDPVTTKGSCRPAGRARRVFAFIRIHFTGEFFSIRAALAPGRAFNSKFSGNDFLPALRLADQPAREIWS
jgi:hypothetical protein